MHVDLAVSVATMPVLAACAAPKHNSEWLETAMALLLTCMVPLALAIAR
jgi:hypothetical protein